MNTRTPLRALVALAVLTTASPALAARTSGSRSGGTGIGATTISGWLVLDPGPVDGVGAGFRLTFPIAPGIVQHPRIRDEFVLEPGFDFVHYRERVGRPPGPYFNYEWNGFLAVVGGAWQFWLTPQFALYPKLDLGYWWGWYSGWDDRYGYGRGDYGGLFFQAAAGLIYRFDRASLRLELGSGLIRLGLGFAF